MEEKKKIFLSSPTMHGEELKFINEAFETNWVAPLGKNVDGFEEDMAKYLGEGMHAAALSSGTDAIHLALIIAGIKRDDIVFGTSLTFAATVNPISYIGAVPVFIDSDRESWNMDPEALRKAFEKYPNAKAVIAADLYGTPVKLDEIEKICKEHNAVFIEDSAESLGSSYKGRKTGTYGDIGILSFNGNKIITTSGGGMMVSKNEEFVKKARFLSTQAREKARHYEHKEVGFNYRMSNIVAGIGRGQMLHLDEHVAKKKEIRKHYIEGLKDIEEISFNPFYQDSDINAWLTCIALDRNSKVKPLDIMEALEKENIETRPIWKPMHLQPVYKERDFISIEGGEGVGGDIFNRGLCLPCDIKNTDEDMDRIIGIIRGLFNR